MIIIQVLDIVLAALILTMATWTVAVREPFSATVGYVAYGLLLSLVWVRLFAVDVALTEAAIGGGVTGVLLISAAVRLRRTLASRAHERLGARYRLVAGALCAVIATGLAAGVLLLPNPPPSLAPQAIESLAKTGLGNPITAVLIAYRAFDTLLEKVVLVLALVSVWSLAPDRYWGRAPSPPCAVRSNEPLSFLAQVLPPLGILIGIHIFWVGADDPGGAFQGGAILAAMWMIVMMARITDAPEINTRWLRLSLVSGPAVFLAAGVLGCVLAGGFLAYPAGFAKPIILFIEAFMTLSIAATLPMLVAGPPDRAMRP
jgi:multisubunit Na+/H+ antiporter MnhB subunit